MRISGQDPRAGWLPVFPLVVLQLVFFLGPLLILAWVSTFDTPDMKEHGLAAYYTLVSDGISLGVLLRTIALGAGVALVSLVLGYGIAYVHARVSSRVQAMIILLVVTPLLTSTVVRAFAWMVILGRNGPVNQALLQLGLTSLPLRLLGSQSGLIIAMAQIELPLMVLPLITAFSALRPSLAEASQSLGASRARTFFKIELVLSRPGAIAGTVLVFAASTGSFISQSLIGGGRMLFMPVHLYEQAVTLQHWPFAAVLSLTMIAAVLLVVAGVLSLGRIGGRVHA